MSLFSKLFGGSKPASEPPRIPADATARETIDIAISSVIGEAGGNCATLELAEDSGRWIQIVDSSINCHYPHQESPELLFPGLCGHPLIAGLEHFEAGQSMTVSLTSMNQPEIAAWIEQYLSQVLSFDLSGRLVLRMERL